MGTVHHCSVEFDVTDIACVAVAKGGRHARDDVGGVDQAVNRHFPEFIGKFGGTDTRASEGVTGGDAVGRLNARGGDDGKGTAETMACDVERQAAIDLCDGCNEVAFYQGESFSKTCGVLSYGLRVALKANVDDGEELARG